MPKATKSSLPKPLLDRVIITDRPLPPKAGEEKVGGIVIPEGTSASSKAQILNPHFEATVLAAGPECKHVHVGDRVVVTGANCYPVKVGDKTYTFTRDHEIVAVL
jgi:co-chaperonin GroES (HSP10)